MRLSLLQTLFFLLSTGALLQAQPAHRSSPILCTLQARYARDPATYPNQERLARYRFYWIFAPDGRKVGDLKPLGLSPWPSFRIVGSKGTSRASLILTRPEKSGWVVRNEHFQILGKIHRLRAQAGEYDWRNMTDASIGALIPVSGTLFYEVRGGDELKALFEETWKVPLTPPSQAKQKRFQKLYQDFED
jgi:hypothetical protein